MLGFREARNSKWWFASAEWGVAGADGRSLINLGLGLGKEVLTAGPCRMQTTGRGRLDVN